MAEPICTECRQEMTCVRTGLLVVFRDHGDMAWARPTDEFECPTCKGRVAIGGRCSDFAQWMVDQKEDSGYLLRMPTGVR